VENVSRRARSVDVFQQGRFLFPRQPLTSPSPKSQPKCIKGWPFCIGLWWYLSPILPTFRTS